jgi:four helix bundle protein
MNSDELSDRLWRFAARIGKVVDALPDSRMGRHVAGQLVRCGTAAGPNYDEGCAAESRADFAHKLSIALKELKETRGWLRFIPIAELLPEKRIVVFGRGMSATDKNPRKIRRDRESQSAGFENVKCQMLNV